MARPKKDGLDYFPLDVDIDQDDKVIIIIAKYGMEGFGILVKLMMEIYKNGYYYNWTEREQLVFSSRVNVNINTIQNVVNDCIKWGLFNEDMFNSHQVLTSKGIQSRYLLATSRRLEVTIEEKYKLIVVNVDINPKSVRVNDDKSTQSKVKESKVNKTKEKKVKYAEFVSMKKEEYEKLIEQFGEPGAIERIEKLNLYKGSTGKKYKEDYLTILSWERKDNKNKPVQTDFQRPLMKGIGD
jgi:glutamine synthetase type III